MMIRHGIRSFHLTLWLGVTLALVGLQTLLATGAPDGGTLVEKLPRAYIGEFVWDGDRAIQNVAIKFEAVRASGNDRIEAIGCGFYDLNGLVTKIKVRMMVRLLDLQVEIWESAPGDAVAFDTNGSHQGNLTTDLRQINARWVSQTGRSGKLRLEAASSAECGPSRSL